MRCRVTMKSGIGVIGVALVKMIVMVVEMEKTNEQLVQQLSYDKPDLSMSERVQEVEKRGTACQMFLSDPWSCLVNKQ